MRNRLLSLSAATFVAAGVYGSTLGWGTDRDSIRVLQSAHAMLQGHYLRSRSFGFPLHEAISAILAACGGVCAVNLGSLWAACAGVVLGACLLPPGRRAWGAVALCFCPIVLVNAASAIDFDYDLMAGMALCHTAQRVSRGSRGGLALHAAAAAALLLFRPDNLLFLAAVTIAASLLYRSAARQYFASAAAAALLAACVYLGLNGTGMLGTAVTTTRPIAARLLRAALFLTAALGPGGALALSVIARPPARLRFLPMTALIAWALYLPRFLLLPDQMDYLILPVVITLIAAIAEARQAWLWPLTIAAALPSLVTLSVLVRDPQTGAVHVSPQLQWGALVQDWQARRFAAAMEAPQMTARIAAHVGTAALHYDVFLPAYVSAGRDLVIGRPHLYRVLDSGAGLAASATVARARYNAIWACDVPLGPGSGWRAWEAPETGPRSPLSCTKAASAQD